MKHAFSTLFSIATITATSWFAAPTAQARDLSFEERVEAQQAIERVYHSHQIGTEASFEEAVPRELLERKVVKYLKQSAALEEVWQRPVTAEMLERELQRMSRGTRMPDRLREIFTALHDDPLLIQESLARATLADRLTRNFFAFDSRFHAEAKRETDALHEALTDGTLDPWQEHPRRSEVELILESDDGGPEDDSWLTLSPSQFDRWRGRLADLPGAVRREEEREAFQLRVLLEENDTRLRVATYRVEKTAWDEWWSTVSLELNDEAVVTVASPEVSVPDELGKSAGPAGDPCADDDTWDTLEGLPGPRMSHTSVWTGSEMLVWGGSDGSSYFNTGGRYDPATDSWTPISIVNAPSPRRQHTAVWTGSEMLVWGGFDPSSLTTGGRYDPATDSWTAISTAGAPAPRTFHTAVWTGGEMLVWGGSYLNTGARYDPATDSWTTTSTVGAPAPRTLHTAVWTGGEMVVWGGYGGASHFNTGGRYDPATDSWTATSTAGAPSPRRNHSAIWTGNLMLVWGGYDGTSYFDTGARYDPATDIWMTISADFDPSPRRQHTAVWTGIEMVIWGGYNGSALKTGGRYLPATDSWTGHLTVDTPVPRYLHTAVWTGSEMVIWGGYGGYSGNYTALLTGGRYHPLTDSWTATSTADTPSPRRNHTAVWTGSKMLIWGGYGGYSGTYISLNTGGRYDPATHSWTATSTVDAPSPRHRHTAVWTGSEMVVWGGSSSSTGGRYDPATDSWMATSTADAPLPRSDHTAVWTGSLMVVWGGDGAAYFNTGGRYDPATDSWRATSTADAPWRRDDHTAVWTGSLMLVWGGYADGSQVNTGGRYDPAADSWTATSTAGAPLPRFWHTAIWTGSEMVIWGGFETGGPELNTGGRYDPATDSWTATSTSGAPLPRWGHTAVWTGSLMLVWGGSEGGVTTLNTGGRYNPASDVWAATSTVGASSPRRLHTAVWTDDLRMLVWGGEVSGAVLNNGGSYAVGPDDDDDGFVCSGDCDDGNDQVWATPGEALDLVFVPDFVPNKETLGWNAPLDPGATSLLYDALWSGDPADFTSGSGAECLESDGDDRQATDTGVPAIGSARYYLVRAQNDCPAGLGTLGTGHLGEREGRACP